MRSGAVLSAAVILAIALLGGCTVHPQGEREQRHAALQAGMPFEKPIEQRIIPPLPRNPTADDLVRYALLANADVERRYWEWRSAIDQIPQDGTQPTNLAVSVETSLDRGSFSRDGTALAAMNDPMADIVWPEKLSVAAKRALENARAAGLLFQKAEFDLRNRVLIAYFDYELTVELIGLEERNADLLQMTVTAVEARETVGAVGQQDVLKTRNELDMSRNDIANMKSQVPALLAAINALLNRSPGASLDLPVQLPTIRPMNCSDEQLLALTAKRNPELAAMASEIKGKIEGIRLARLQYMPDFSMSAGTDLAAVAQSLTGMVTVPLLKYQAIDAAVAQAEANLKSADAMLRQARNDLNTRVTLDISTLRDADRQLDLFEHAILPRARQAVVIARSSYETGQSTLPDLLDRQRSQIALERLAVDLRIAREKRLADLEAIAAVDLEATHNDKAAEPQLPVP